MAATKDPDAVDEGMTMEEFGVEEFKALPEEDAPPEDFQGKPYPTEHSARIHPPGRYKRFRRQNDKFGSGIHAIWGVRKDNDKVEVQAIRFAKTKFTVAQAKAWLREHDYTVIRFEPASKTADPESPDGAARVEDPKPDSTGDAGADAGADGQVQQEGHAVPDDVLKNATYVRYLQDARIEFAKDEDPAAENGVLMGYASAFDVVDLQLEIIRKGAFAKTIKERPRVPLMAMHFGSGGDIKECVGVVMRMEEDDYGLKFRAEFLGDETSQNVRKKVYGLREKGIQVGDSIGYRQVKCGPLKIDDEYVLEHTEVALGEVTLTLKAANQGAYVTDSKTDDGANHAVVNLPMNDEPEALAGEASRIRNAFPDEGDAAKVAGRLEKLAEEVRKDLAADKPRDAGADAGGAEGEDAATTLGKVDPHSRREVEAARRRMVMLGLLPA